LPDEPEAGLQTLNRLLEALTVEGPANFAELGRQSGLSPETVRYKVITQFPKKGLQLHLSLNYSSIGLQRKIIIMSFSKDALPKASAVMSEMARRLYISYYAKVIGSNSYWVTVSVPDHSWTEYKDFLQCLVEDGILEAVSTDDLLWSRHLPMKSDFFDFDKGLWVIDWSKIDRITLVKPVSAKAEEIAHRPDHVDIGILAEMQVDATLSLSSIAKNLHLGEDSVYYHYKDHIKNRGMLSHYVVSWTGVGGRYDRSSVTNMVLMTRDSEANLSDVQLVCQQFPFAWQEMMTKDFEYCLFARIPSEHFSQAMHYLDSKLSSARKSTQILLLDSYDSAGFTIPSEMFDKDKGWTFNKARAIKDFESLCR